MNRTQPSRLGVVGRATATLAALSPLLLVESIARGSAWIVAMLSGLGLALALAWTAQRMPGSTATPNRTELDVAVIALLVALLLPAGSTWMSSCLAVAVAVLLGRQAFGGLGQALFNPAMAGLAVLGLILYGTTADAPPWSAWAAPATWLGAFVLVLCGVVPWRTPFAFLVGAAVAAAIMPPAGVSPSLSALAVASHPAWVLCAFFIAADSTSGCLQPRARLAFGLGCGLLVVAFDHRQPASGLPMAILLMNFVAPWLDQVLARPRQKVLSP